MPTCCSSRRRVVVCQIHVVNDDIFRQKLLVTLTDRRQASTTGISNESGQFDNSRVVAGITASDAAMHLNMQSVWAVLANESVFVQDVMTRRVVPLPATVAHYTHAFLT